VERAFAGVYTNQNVVGALRESFNMAWSLQMPVLLARIAFHVSHSQPFISLQSVLSKSSTRTDHETNKHRSFPAADKSNPRLYISLLFVLPNLFSIQSHGINSAHVIFIVRGGGRRVS
jgi:hypothetical protein